MITDRIGLHSVLLPLLIQTLREPQKTYVLTILTMSCYLSKKNPFTTTKHQRNEREHLHKAVIKYTAKYTETLKNRSFTALRLKIKTLLCIPFNVSCQKLTSTNHPIQDIWQSPEHFIFKKKMSITAHS